MPKKFTLKERLKSFCYAFRGVLIMLRSQHNAWIHAMATIVICTLGLYLRITSMEWCWILLAIMAVWMAESLNTALEFLADAALPQYHPMVEKAKDVAAGAVLITAVGTVVIGFLILGPYVFKY
jgi:diacylglycerol kinase (ATP)